MTWEELIDKLKDTNVDIINEFKTNKYADISNKETQKEFEKIGMTPDILYHQAINELIYNHISNNMFKRVNVDFETNPLEAIIYRKVCENIDDIRKEFSSLFKNEDELVDFFKKNKL